jgi:hypothetical protein
MPQGLVQVWVKERRVKERRVKERREHSCRRTRRARDHSNSSIHTRATHEERERRQQRQQLPGALATATPAGGEEHKQTSSDDTNK